MTRQSEQDIICHVCHAKMLCPTCGKTQKMGTPFSWWLRELKYPLDSQVFDNENLDYIWFNYREGWLITIEEKQNGGRSSQAQQDTHGVIRQMLELSSGTEIQTLRKRRKIEYRGHYVIAFENMSPTDSRWIRINDVMTDEVALRNLLETGTFVQDTATVPATPQRRIAWPTPALPG